MPTHIYSLQVKPELTFPSPAEARSGHAVVGGRLKSGRAAPLNAVGVTNPIRHVLFENRYPCLRQPQMVAIRSDHIRCGEHSDKVLLQSVKGEVFVRPLKPVAVHWKKNIRQLLGLTPRRAQLTVKWQGQRLTTDGRAPAGVVELFRDQDQPINRIHYDCKGRSLESIGEEVGNLLDGSLLMAREGASVLGVVRHIHASVGAMGLIKGHSDTRLVSVLAAAGMRYARQGYQWQYELERLHNPSDPKARHERALQVRAMNVCLAAFAHEVRARLTLPDDRSVATLEGDSLGEVYDFFAAVKREGLRETLPETDDVSSISDDHSYASFTDSMASDFEDSSNDADSNNALVGFPDDESDWESTQSGRTAEVEPDPAPQWPAGRRGLAAATVALSQASGSEDERVVHSPVFGDAYWPISLSAADEEALNRLQNVVHWAHGKRFKLEDGRVALTGLHVRNHVGLGVCVDALYGCLGVLNSQLNNELSPALRADVSAIRQCLSKLVWVDHGDSGRPVKILERWLKAPSGTPHRGVMTSLDDKPLLIRMNRNDGRITMSVTRDDALGTLDDTGWLPMDPTATDKGRRWPITDRFVVIAALLSGDGSADSPTGSRAVSESLECFLDGLNDALATDNWNQLYGFLQGYVLESTGNVFDSPTHEPTTLDWLFSDMADCAQHSESVMLVKALFMHGAFGFLRNLSLLDLRYALMDMAARKLEPAYRPYLKAVNEGRFGESLYKSLLVRVRQGMAGEWRAAMGGAWGTLVDDAEGKEDGF